MNKLTQEQEDNIAALRAHYEGKPVQFKNKQYGDWNTTESPNWDFCASDYRPAPFDLNSHVIANGFRPLAAGEHWHRDDWTEEMLEGAQVSLP